MKTGSRLIGSSEPTVKRNRLAKSLESPTFRQRIVPPKELKKPKLSIEDALTEAEEDRDLRNDPWWSE